MNNFAVGPRVYDNYSVEQFLDEIKNTDKDLFLITRIIYDTFLKKYELKGNIMLYEDYCNGEPNDTCVTAMIQALKDIDANRIIAIGGGSVLDTAKLLCVEGAESTEQIYEDKIKLERKKELYLISTTSGTGTEMTCVSVIDREKQKSKIGKRIESNFADKAFLIPELLYSIPRTVFAYSTIDALIHAMEIYVSPNASNYSKLFCKEAISLIVTGFQKLKENGIEQRFEYMDDFLRASNYAGIALANDVCGAVHACAMHFGSKNHVGHGESNYTFLTAVFKTYNSLQPDNKELKDVKDIIAAAMKLDSVNSQFDIVLDELDKLLDTLVHKKKLSEYGVKEDELMDYVNKVFETQQRLLINNAVKMNKEEFINIYRLAI